MDALAAATARATGDRPYVLVGYSIGGVLAHSAAAVLERSGRAPAGVVLLDTFDPAQEQAPVFAWAMGELLDRDPGSVAVDDEGLLTMGAYLRLAAGWEAAPTTAPSLLVRADDTGPAPRWPLWPADDVATVAGAGHFSLIEEHAAATAAAVDSWLSAGPRPAAGAVATRSGT